MTKEPRHATVARNDDLYEAFPDICRLPSGKLLCIYREADVHVASTSRIILIESDDRGRTWTNPRQLDERLTFAQDLAVWNAPRIGQLPDGRLVVNIDAFVFPEDAADWNWPQSLLSSLTYLWFSEDDGRTWTERHLTEVQGFCTDKILALTADHWLTAVAYWSIRFPGAFRLHTVHSHDGGLTWPLSALTAEQDGYQHDEPSVVRLEDGRLLCVMRENVHTTRPSHYVLSEDDGYTWSTPRPAPFYGDRPAAGLLQSGKLLAIYRNVEPKPGATKLNDEGRNPGTWLGWATLPGSKETGESRNFWKSSMTAANRRATMATAAGSSSKTARFSASIITATPRPNPTSAAAGSARRSFIPKGGDLQQQSDK